MAAAAVNFAIIIVVACSLVRASSSWAPATAVGYDELSAKFYEKSCPRAEEIVRSVVEKAVAKEARMAASLIRLHFHDCFVKGCDGSILLDSTGWMSSEKRSNPNRDSARGFEVVDAIKTALEEECPRTVSCADILAIAARDSTILAGGPTWEVGLGRRDSLGASLSGSNHNIPAPNDTLLTIITKFKLKHLDLIDLVALSGSHTIGMSRCASFRRRLYGGTKSSPEPDTTLDAAYAARLREEGCPATGGGAELFPLDPVSPGKFDNLYYKNLLAGEGLLASDEVLLTGSEDTAALVKRYAESEEAFFEQFAVSMVRLGNVAPLTGYMGEIRENCRKVNKPHW